LPGSAGAQTQTQSAPPPDPKTVAGVADSRFFNEFQWEFEQRAYPLGYVPTDAHERGLQATRQARSVQQPVTGNGWTNIGPAPVLGAQTPGSRAVSGRVASIAVDPGNLAHWLIGGAQGGIWETTDTGTTWAARTDAQGSLAMGAIWFASNNPSIVYAGTGEPNFSGDSYGGAGLLKSTDGGSTWNITNTAQFAGNAVSAVRVDPTNANTLVASTVSAIFGRVPAFPSSTPPFGVYRSTDGGTTFSFTLSGQVSDLASDPTNFSHLYAGINTFGSGNPLWRSLDGGQTFSLVTGPWGTSDLGRVAFAIAPSNPNTIYVSIARQSNSQLFGLFRSDNAWAATPTWTQITSAPNFCNTQCWYDQALAVDPTNPNILYAGGLGVWRFDGSIWTEIDNVANGIHVDQHSLVFASSRLIAGNDGGVWSTTDSGANWNDHNTTLSTIQFYDGSLHSTDPNFALGGSQDNGTEKWTGAAAWNFVFGGDGAANAISSSAPNTNWAVSFQGLNIARTTNGGASFISATSGINLSNAPFISKFEKCPSNDDVFIAGTDTLWRSNNFFTAATPTWSANSPAVGSITGVHFAVSDATCSTYAFGTSGGALRLTSNAGATWTDIDVSNAVPNRAVTDVAFDPTNANVLYVTLSGFDQGTPGQPGHVFKTSNVLAANPTWTNVTPPVNLPFNTIISDPGAPSTIYAGSDLGVWMSTDGGASWAHMGPQVGMPNVAVFELRINAATNRLVAFTHGRGALALTTVPVVHPIEPLASPQRLVDTRTMGGPILAGQSRCFPIAGQGGIPSNANAVVLNVTAADYVNNGWLTVFPNGQPVPATSTVNFDSHEYAIANGQIIGIGTNGQVCVNAGAATSDAILDATGYVPNAAASELPLLITPQRLVDTRFSGGPIPAGQSRCFVIAGQGGIPSNAAAVVLNATAVSYTSNGWLTLYPNGQPVPATSTVNFDTREYAIANNAIIGIGTGGQVCVNAGLSASNVILDATGYLTTAGAAQMPLLTAPQRLVDTRVSGGPIGAGQTRCFTIAGMGGIAGNALVALLNMTAADYTANGWLTGFPNGQALPATSTVNFDVHEYAIANGTILKIGTGGQVCVNAGLSASDVILDATGYELP
jgi:hypothetical protein